MLELRVVGFSYPKHRKDLPSQIENLSFSVGRGEVIALLGSSGCGKSTVLKIIAGLLQEQEGELRMDGEHFHKRLGKVGFMPQQDMLYSWLRIADNVALPLRLRGVGRTDARREVLPLLEHFGLQKYHDFYPHQLSEGMRQRIALLRTAMCSRTVLVLDEPFSKLDYFTRQDCIVWARQLLAELNAITVFVSHDIDEILHLATKVIVVSSDRMHILAEVDAIRTESEHGQLSAHQLKIKNSLLESLYADAQRNHARRKT